jgi:NTE family protein
MTLVLAGGGVGAIAWELGVLRGLADVDAGLAQKVIDADTVIGTSGGLQCGRPDHQWHVAR